MHKKKMQLLVASFGNFIIFTIFDHFRTKKDQKSQK